MTSSRRSRSKRRGSPHTKAQRPSADSRPRDQPHSSADDAEERFDIPLEELQQLRRRIAQQQLEPDDWSLFSGLVQEQIEHTEEMLGCMLASITADTVAEQAKDPVLGAGGSKPGESTDGLSSSSAYAESDGDSTEPVDSGR